MTLKDNNNGTFSIVAPCSFEDKYLTDQQIVDIYKKIHNWDVKLGDKNWIALAREIEKEIKNVQKT